jgi:enoyl-CoA hydratase/carnithine racemase
VLDYVQRIAALSPVAIALGKAAFYGQAELGEASAYELAKAVMVENALEPDAQEGFRAFVEKRSPRFGRPTT